MGLLIICQDSKCHKANGERRLLKAKAAKEIKGDVCLKCKQSLKNPKTGKMHYGIEYRNDAGELTREHNRNWDKKEAEQRLREIQSAKADGDSIPQKRDAKTMFHDLAEWYLNLNKVKDKSSYVRDVRSVGKLNEFFGNRLLKDILPATVEDYIHKRQNELSYRGHLTKPATINRELACMKTIYNKAIDNNKAQRSPFRRGMMLKENNARKRKLSIEEYSRLIAECPIYIEPVLKLAYYTGMRRGEILKLTWDMIDLKRGAIDLPHEICKTDEGRFVPLNQELVGMFNAMAHGLPGVPVFTRKAKPFTGSTIRVGLRIACERAEIKGFTFHDFRRTAKTHMLKAGVDKVYRDLILGHKVQGMDIHYISLSENDLHQAMDRYTEWLLKAEKEALAKPDVHQNVHQSGFVGR